MKEILGVYCDVYPNRINVYEDDFNTLKKVKKFLKMVTDEKAVLTDEGYDEICIKYDWNDLLPKDYDGAFFHYREEICSNLAHSTKNILILNHEDIANILSGKVYKNLTKAKIIFPEGKLKIKVETFKDILANLQENISLGSVKEDKLLNIWDLNIEYLTDLDTDIDFENYTLADVYYKLFDFSIPFINRVDDAYQMLINMILDEEKPLYLKSVPEYVMERILISLERNYSNSKISDFKKNCYVTFMEKLCNLNNQVGLDIKAYAYYGGNSVVECNYKISEECLLKLVDMYYDSSYANTLGYIYYYGRVNGGEPEYEKAFNYYNMAAINGNVESIYKLGDMYRNGYGVKQNEQVARITYEKLYDRVLSEFYDNQDNSSLPDVALRIASFYDGYKEGALPAAMLYLQSLMSMNYRHNFYDDSIRKQIVANIVNLYNCYGEEIKEEFALAHALSYCKNFVVKREGNSIVIINEIKTIVVDIQDMNCEFTDRIVVNFEGKILKGFKNRSYCTKVDMNNKGEYIFYHNSIIIGKIAAGPYKIEHKNKLINNLDSNEYRVAICQFNRGKGKKYTFLVDEEGSVSDEWYVEETGKDIYPIEFKVIYGYELPYNVDKMKHITKKIVC